MSSETIRQTIDESEIVEHDIINGIYKLTDGREVISANFSITTHIGKVISKEIRTIIDVGDAGAPTQLRGVIINIPTDFNPPA